ncbi:uncharacterized protein EV422DRAFT_581992 [Fimicolochytrium jonesii]|uniref:uncharacterized protein n=1 Tax=Fimicolochytrium jonesii TaxID=1396493 RepID=UPI0022FEDCD1|nr:uncharacterized protein EV422DRAFT_581992 [Fimicolochytrium jonesii]KAI8815623.1 hypothetical protein EV422DRAFT_581992 [Fimicolochytrium jonesii]
MGNGVGIRSGSGIGTRNGNGNGAGPFDNALSPATGAYSYPQTQSHMSSMVSDHSSYTPYSYATDYGIGGISTPFTPPATARISLADPMYGPQSTIIDNPYPAQPTPPPPPPQQQQQQQQQQSSPAAPPNLHSASPFNMDSSPYPLQPHESTPISFTSQPAPLHRLGFLPMFTGGGSNLDELVSHLAGAPLTSPSTELVSTPASMMYNPQHQTSHTSPYVGPYPLQMHRPQSSLYPQPDVEPSQSSNYHHSLTTPSYTDLIMATHLTTQYSGTDIYSSTFHENFSPQSMNSSPLSVGNSPTYFGERHSTATVGNGAGAEPDTTATSATAYLASPAVKSPTPGGIFSQGGDAVGSRQWPEFPKSSANGDNSPEVIALPKGRDSHHPPRRHHLRQKAPHELAKDHAAAIVRKKTLELVGSCKLCNNALAKFNIRGSKDQLEGNVTIDIICNSCSPMATGTTSSLSPKSATAVEVKTEFTSPPPTSPIAPQGRRFECEICKKFVAVGKVTNRPNALIDRNTTIEVVCSECRVLWGFCTECGGGGKYRTGKYRPTGLFLPSRRTCMLPHFRLGLAPVHFATHTKEDFPMERSQALGEVYRDAFLSLYATPKVMQEVPIFSELANMKRFLNNAWDTAVRHIMDDHPQSQHNPTTTKWYCTTASITPHIQPKSRGRRHNSPAGVQQMEKGEKGLREGLLAAGKGGDEERGGKPSGPPPTESGSPTTSTHPSSSSSPSTDAHTTGGPTSYVGVCISEHHPPTRTLYIAEVAVMQSAQSHGIAQKLILHTLSILPLPQHLHYIYFLTRRVNAPMQRFGEKNGFLPFDVFFQTYPRCAVDKGLFAREEYDLDEYVIYIARWEVFVERAGRVASECGLRV